MSIMTSIGRRHAICSSIGSSLHSSDPTASFRFTIRAYEAQVSLTSKCQHPSTPLRHGNECYVHIIFACPRINERRYDQGSIQQLCMKQGGLEYVANLIFPPNQNSKSYCFETYIIPSETQAPISHVEAIRFRDHVLDFVY